MTLKIVKNMPKLSIVIITFNEEKNIGRCLESLQEIADDIVVVDSFSTDATQNICKRYRVNFIQRKWEGYSETKNFGNSKAKYDWILSLDADEALSDELKQSILKAKQGTELVACKFNRLTNYCGTWIKHCGWYPDTKTRIFDRRTAYWHGMLHESLFFLKNKSILHLKGDCLHYSYYTKEDHYKQVDNFTTIAANSLYKQGSRAFILKTSMSPVIKFVRDYFIKLGILDGISGYTICKISAYATFLKYKKLRNLNESKKQISI